MIPGTRHSIRLYELLPGFGGVGVSPTDNTCGALRRNVKVHHLQIRANR